MKEVKKIQLGFTLIELLIVVLIIAILAAIAVPNFLEFQTRAKVSRTMADIRSVATALEAYFVDNDVYPPNVWSGYPAQNGPGSIPAEDSIRCLWRLTTPVSYMSSTDAMRSKFISTDQPPSGLPFPENAYWYVAANTSSSTGGSGINNHLFWWAREASMEGSSTSSRWMIGDSGPDQVLWQGDDFRNQYDPTNGTVSGGNIYRFGP